MASTKVSDDLTHKLTDEVTAEIVGARNAIERAVINKDDKDEDNKGDPDREQTRVLLKAFRHVESGQERTDQEYDAIVAGILEGE